MNSILTGLSSVRTAYIDPSISAITSRAQYASGALSAAVTYGRSMISQMPTASEGYTLALSTLNSMGTTVGSSLNAMKTTVINSGSSFVKSSMASANQGMAHASAFGSRQMTNLSTALNPTYQFAVSKFSAMAKTAAPYLDAVKTRAMDPAVAFGSRQIQKLPTTTQAREAVVSTITAMGDRSTTIGKTTVLVRNVVAVSVIVSAVACGIWKLSTYIRDLKVQLADAKESLRSKEEVSRLDVARISQLRPALDQALADRDAAREDTIAAWAASDRSARESQIALAQAERAAETALADAEARIADAEARIADAVADRDAAVAASGEAEAQVDALRIQSTDLEGRVAIAQAEASLYKALHEHDVACGSKPEGESMLGRVDRLQASGKRVGEARKALQAVKGQHETRAITGDPAAILVAAAVDAPVDAAV